MECGHHLQTLLCAAPIPRFVRCCPVCHAVTGVAVMFAAPLLQLIWPRRVHVLILSTSSGDVDAVTSRHKEFVSNLKKAIEQAFVVRAGEQAVTAVGDYR